MIVFAAEQQREAHELMGKLTDRIEKLISEAEEAGCSGEVEEVCMPHINYVTNM